MMIFEIQNRACEKVGELTVTIQGNVCSAELVAVSPFDGTWAAREARLLADQEVDLVRTIATLELERQGGGLLLARLSTFREGYDYYGHLRRMLVACIICMPLLMVGVTDIEISVDADIRACEDGMRAPALDSLRVPLTVPYSRISVRMKSAIDPVLAMAYMTVADVVCI
jgi:hypothetical protein